MKIKKLIIGGGVVGTASAQHPPKVPKFSAQGKAMVNMEDLLSYTREVLTEIKGIDQRAKLDAEARMTQTEARNTETDAVIRGQ